MKLKQVSVKVVSDYVDNGRRMSKGDLIVSMDREKAAMLLEKKCIKVIPGVVRESLATERQILDGSPCADCEDSAASVVNSDVESGKHLRSESPKNGGAIANMPAPKKRGRTRLSDVDKKKPKSNQQGGEN